MFPKGSMLSARPTKHTFKRSISHKESNTHKESVSPPPTKQEKTVSLRFSKQSDNIKHNRSPVKDSAEPSSSVSKLPLRGQRSSNQMISRNITLPDFSSNTSTSKQEDTNQTTKTETAVEEPDSSIADQVEDSAGDDRFKFKSQSTEDEEHMIRLKDSQSSTGEFKPKGKGTKEVEESKTSLTNKKISKTQSVQNNDDTVTKKTQARVAPVTGQGAEVFTNSEAILSLSPVTDVNKAEADSNGGQCETNQQTRVETPPENVSHIQTQQQEMPFSAKICPVDSKENDILETTRTPDSVQEKEPDFAGLDKDTIAAHKDVTDISAKPVLFDGIHGNLLNHTDQEGVMAGRVSLNSEKQQRELLKDQTMNIILENDRLPTFSRNVVKDLEVEERSKEELGRKPTEALGIQTETVTVFESTKNAENQLDKEPLLLAGKFERLEKDSKPNERQNDTAVESADSQNNCKKELKGRTIEDQAEKDIKEPQKPTHLSSEERCLQPDSEKEPRMVVTDVLQEKKTETDQTRSALQDNTDGVVDAKTKCGILFRENAGSVDKEMDSQMKASTVKSEPETKEPLTKDEKVRDNESNQDDKHTDIVKESQTQEPKALGIITQSAEGTKKESETKASGKNLPNKISNEIAENEVSSLEDQTAMFSKDQDVDSKTTEESASASAEFRCQKANLEKQVETEKDPGKTADGKVIQIDTTQVKDLSEIKFAEGETERKDSSVKNLVNKTIFTNSQSEVSIQEDQKSKTVVDKDEDITKPETNKSIKSKHPDANQEHKPKTVTTESLKTKEDTKLSGKTTKKAVRKTNKKQEEKAIIKKDVKVENEVTKQEEQQMKASKIDAKQESGPVILKDASIKTSGEEQKDKTTVVPDQVLGTDAQKKDTEAKELLNKEKEVRENELNLKNKHTDVSKESQTPDLKASSAKSQSAEGTNEERETKAFAKNLPSEMANETAESEVSSQKDQATIICRDQDEDIKKNEENTSTGKAPGNTTDSNVLQMDTSQELSEIKSAEEEIARKDSSIKRTENKTTFTKSINEVTIQEDQKSNIVRDKDEDIIKPEKNKSIQSQHQNANQEHKPKTETKESLKINEDTKLSGKTTKKAVRKTNKKQEEKAIIKKDVKVENEVTKQEEQQMKASKIDAKQESGPVILKDASIKTSGEEQKDKTTVVPDQVLGTDAQKKDTEAKELLNKEKEVRENELNLKNKHTDVSKESQTPDLKASSAKSQSAEGTNEERETKAFAKNLPSEMANKTAESEVCHHKDWTTVVAREQDEDIKTTEEIASTSAESKCQKANLEKQIETEKAPEKTTEGKVLQTDTTQGISKTQSTVGTKEDTETKYSSVKGSVNETAITNSSCEVSIQRVQKSIIHGDQSEDITKHDNKNMSRISKYGNANPEQEPETVTKESLKTNEDTKLAEKTTEKAARKTNKKQEQQTIIKDDDRQIKASKTDAKQESRPGILKDVSIKTSGGKQKVKTTLGPDKVLNATEADKNDQYTKGKTKMNGGVKQDPQTSREKNMNLSDLLKPTKPSLIDSSSLLATVKPSTPSQSLQLKKESPSSWLDVEYYQKHKREQNRRLNASASEDEPLESDDYENFIRSIKQGSIPFSEPPKRHSHKKSPAPPFAMPSIKEDHFERTFDPEQFQFGLSKKSKSLRDLSPGMVIKEKAAKREGWKRAMEKHAQDKGKHTARDQMNSLDEVKGQDGVKKGINVDSGEENKQNNGEEPGKPTSRLGRMSILSSLLSTPQSSRKARKEATSVSNSTCSSNQQQDLPSAGKQGVVDSPLPGIDTDKKGVKSTDQGPPVGAGTGTVIESAPSSSSPPPLPSFSEIKLPHHLEKYLKTNKRESEAFQGSTQRNKTTSSSEGSTMMDHNSIAGATNVDVGLKGRAGMPPASNYSEQTTRNGLSTSKPKVGFQHCNIQFNIF